MTDHSPYGALTEAIEAAWSGPNPVQADVVIPLAVALALLDQVDDVAHALETADIWIGMLKPRMPHVERMLYSPGERKRICRRLADLRVGNSLALDGLFGIDSKMRRRRPARRRRRKGGDR